MKSSANRNFLAASLSFAWDTFGEYLSGTQGSLLCARSQTPLSDTAKHALESSAAALGFGQKGCTYVNLQANAEDGTLGANDLRMIVEAIDPESLIACDAQSASMLSHGYGTEVATNKANRVLGRTCIAFVGLEDMLDTSESKQKVWALLKKLK